MTEITGSSTKGLQDCVITKNVTVSKLSQLQKRILIYTRRQMLSKGQTIKPATGVTFWIPAPDWLAVAMRQALSDIMKARKGFLLGETHMYDLNNWEQFFEEIVFFNEAISAAAKKVGKKINMFEVDPLRLYKLCDSVSFALTMIATKEDKKLVIFPWPFFLRERWL